MVRRRLFAGIEYATLMRNLFAYRPTAKMGIKPWMRQLLKQGILGDEVQASGLSPQRVILSLSHYSVQVAAVSDCNNAASRRYWRHWEAEWRPYMIEFPDGYEEAFANESAHEGSEIRISDEGPVGEDQASEAASGTPKPDDLVTVPSHVLPQMPLLNCLSVNANESDSDVQIIEAHTVQKIDLPGVGLVTVEMDGRYANVLLAGHEALRRVSAMSFEMIMPFLEGRKLVVGPVEHGKQRFVAGDTKATLTFSSNFHIATIERCRVIPVSAGIVHWYRIVISFRSSVPQVLDLVEM